MTTTREEYESRRMAVADHLISNPEKLDMNTWGTDKGCGTTFCVAGTAAFLSGVELSWSDGTLSFVGSDMESPGRWAAGYLGLPKYDRNDGCTGYIGSSPGMKHAASTADKIFLYGTHLSPEQKAKELLEAAYVDDTEEGQ